MAKVKLEEKFAQARRERMAAHGTPMPATLQDVSKARVAEVLSALDLGTNADLVDCVFALLDDQLPSFFANARDDATFADGASTAHLACHIGILQRGGGKLDREGRDYWIKPLRDLGGIEAITLEGGEFVPGHIKAKSPNSAYSLEGSFVAILRASSADWRGKLAEWAAADAAR